MQKMWRAEITLANSVLRKVFFDESNAYKWIVWKALSYRPVVPVLTANDLREFINKSQWEKAYALLGYCFPDFDLLVTEERPTDKLIENVPNQEIFDKIFAY